MYGLFKLGYVAGKIWCRLRDSNPRPPDYKSGALPAVPRRLRGGDSLTWALGKAVDLAGGVGAVDICGFEFAMAG